MCPKCFIMIILKMILLSLVWCIDYNEKRKIICVHKLNHNELKQIQRQLQQDRRYLFYLRGLFVFQSRASRVHKVLLTPQKSDADKNSSQEVGWWFSPSFFSFRRERICFGWHARYDLCVFVQRVLQRIQVSVNTAFTRTHTQTHTQWCRWPRGGRWLSWYLRHSLDRYLMLRCCHSGTRIHSKYYSICI